MSARVEEGARSFAAFCSCGGLLAQIGSSAEMLPKIKARHVAREDVMTCDCGKAWTFAADPAAAGGKLKLEAVT